MIGMRTLKMLSAMSIPLYDKDGKPLASGKERLVTAGQVHELDDELAQRALDYGAARELTDEEQQAQQGPEEREGDEVNAGSKAAQEALAQQQAAQQQQAANGGTKLERPADDASYADWVAYAKQQGVNASGKKEDVIAKVNAAEAGGES